MDQVKWQAPVPGTTIEAMGVLCRQQGLVDLADRLEHLWRLASIDMAEVEAELTVLRSTDNVIRRAASHLLERGGKRLRPLCVVLASRCGTRPTSASLATARQLAIAAELVHNATLLHDDVVDLGDTRRGGPTARVVFGNAASIFGGDWMIVEAFRRVERTEFRSVFVGLLDVLERMVIAETHQLEARGRLVFDRSAYMSVIEGKTASLFSWALSAGGHAAELSETECEALGNYGQDLGVAFQVVDDVLDYVGGVELGKALFADLDEGKVTLPLIVACERDLELGQLLVALASTRGDALRTEVIGRLRETGAIDYSREFAKRYTDSAVARLGVLPDSAAKEALCGLAVSTLGRLQ